MDNKINRINPNNVAFKSRIVFLSPKGFGKVMDKYKNKKFVNLCNYEILEDENLWCNSYRKNVKRGYTSGVKTCTAGVCVNKGKKAPLFWHVENTYDNIEKFPIISKYIKGTNAIIIGSKTHYGFSRMLYETFISQMKLKNMPATIIQGTNTSEAELFYESKKDTMYVCLKDIYKRDTYVRSKDDLHKSCDIVMISPTDTVEFYDTLPEKSLIEKIKDLLCKTKKD